MKKVKIEIERRMTTKGENSSQEVPSENLISESDCQLIAKGFKSLLRDKD